MKKEYLGDGVYVDHEWGQIILTTETGPEVQDITNRIVLEPEVYTALVAFVEGRLPGKLKESK